MPRTIGSSSIRKVALCVAMLIALAVSGSAAAQEQSTAAMIATYQEIVAELRGDAVDYAAVLSQYEASLQDLVRARDAEDRTPTNHDGEIVSAFEAGMNGSLPPDIVRQIFDKLTQKVFFQSVRHELREVGDHWGDVAAGIRELEEAKAFYAGLAGTVTKREDAYGVLLASPIEGAFEAMETAVRAQVRLDFDLARQVLDKTLMRTFYLAVGGNPAGYIFKIEQAVADGDLEHAKVMQAEGWAFYQSIYSYLRRGSAYDADHILEKLDLRTDVRAIDGDDLNRHFVRSVVGIANHEFDESLASWGEDRAVITALEGALFITLIETDLKEILGEEAYAELASDAQVVLNAAGSGDRALAEAKLLGIRSLLASATR